MGEASALEYARAQARRGAFDPEDFDVNMAGEFCELNSVGRQVYTRHHTKKEQTDVRLRLRLPSGEEIEPPGPLFLGSEASGARLLCPLFLLICCVLLHGLVAEFLLLLYLAEPVGWPIRKRFFSLPGNRALGALTFICSADGQVQVEGEPDEL